MTLNAANLLDDPKQMLSWLSEKHSLAVNFWRHDRVEKY